MEAEWDKGFQDALDWCEAKQKVLRESNYTKTLAPNSNAINEGGLYQRGYREGLITGGNKYYEENKNKHQ